MHHVFPQVLKRDAVLPLLDMGRPLDGLDPAKLAALDFSARGEGRSGTYHYSACYLRGPKPLNFCLVFPMMG